MLALCAVIAVVGWLRGNGFLYMVEVGISLAIAAVPEGLLAVTTMTLAVGMQRMAACTLSCAGCQPSKRSARRR